MHGRISVTGLRLLRLRQTIMLQIKAFKTTILDTRLSEDLEMRKHLKKY